MALLFGLHPLHIESVAWVAERKDVLSTLFWLLAMAGYVRYAHKPSAARYAFTGAMLGLGLMAKPMLVTLPFVFLVLDYWPLKRFDPDLQNLREARKQALRLLAEKMPFFVLVLASSVLTVLAQRSYSAVGSLTDFPFWVRFGNAMVSYVHYLFKMFWPFPMAVYYPHPHTGLAAWKIIVALAILFAITLMVCRLGRRRPYLVFGWLWYLGTLVPVIGLLQVGGQAMADRYTYVPLIGPFVMLCWAAWDLTAHWTRQKKVLTGIAALLTLALFTGTWIQLRYWESSITLFRHTLRVAGPSAVIYNNLGTAYIDKGERDEAIACFKKAVEITPTYAIGLINLGLALYEKKAYDESLEAYRKAMTLSPENASLHNNLGNLYLKRKNLDQAGVHFKKAVDLKPSYVEAQSNLGRVYLEKGQLEKADFHLAQALRLDPDHAKSRNHLGGLLARRGDLHGAVSQFIRSLALNPDDASAHNNLGIALAQIGKLDEAILHFSRSRALDPENDSARMNLELAEKMRRKKEKE